MFKSHIRKGGEGAYHWKTSLKGVVDSLLLIRACPPRSYLRLLARQCHLSVQLHSLAHRAQHLLSADSLGRIRAARRHWFERLAEQLTHSSPLLTSAAAAAEFVEGSPADVIGAIRESLKELAGSVWLGHEYDRAPHNAGLVLKAVGALHAARVDALPLLARRFSGYGRGFDGPELPPFLDVDPQTGWPVSVHLILYSALASAQGGHFDGFANNMMLYLDLVIIRKGSKSLFETPHELTWLLEGLAGVLVGRLRNFHNTVVPTSVVHGFLNRFPALSRAAMRRTSGRGALGTAEKLLRGVAECAHGLVKLIRMDRFTKLKGDPSALALLRLRELLVWVAVQIGIGKGQASDILSMVERLEVPGLKLPEPALREFLEARQWKALFSAMCDLRARSLDPLVLVTRPDVLGDAPWYAAHVKREVAFQDDGTIEMRERTLNPHAPAFVPTSVLLAREKAAKPGEVRKN